MGDQKKSTAGTYRLGYRKTGSFLHSSPVGCIILTGRLKQGAPGYLEEIVVDTLHFRGNYPQAVGIYAMNAGSDHFVAADAEGWDPIVTAHPCEADKEHSFPTALLANVSGKTVTHVKMVIIPDGGVKRLRVYGKRIVDPGC